MLMSEKIEELLRKGSCWGCHDTDEIRVGPSYRSISSKYKNANNQQIRILMEKVRYGGAGNWGVVPMVPISQLSSEELNDLVEWILVQQ
ncbi:MAG: hypothetical protein A3J35_03565 [Gammaproteobacteria bacterium RIFCSPLOWO2_02_FULL_52_10]|nr:MAG: hypothetical protein A3J35_03565 [Gammaproteobacteria bacterium RIFCSPLOWO2_02_FULL_52_10]